jgi:hypothetical protein
MYSQVDDDGVDELLFNEVMAMTKFLQLLLRKMQKGAYRQCSN